MRLPLEKLKAILLYFFDNTDKRYLGKVKLMKLFYFLDFLHVKKYGLPVTYDNYVHLEHGPIPSTIKNLVDQVEEDVHSAILADTINILTTDGQKIHQVVGMRALTEAELKLFSDSEIEILSEVCRRFGTKNTQATEDESHTEAPWRDTQMLESIPYTMAGRDSDSVYTEKEIEFGLSLVL